MILRPEQGVLSAPLPARIIDKGLASDRLVIDTVVSKYGSVVTPILGMWDSEICSRLPGVSNHLIPTTIESGPQRGSTRVSLNPASRIQPLQSAPVKSKPTSVSISMFRLMSKPNVFCRR